MCVAICTTVFSPIPQFLHTHTPPVLHSQVFLIPMHSSLLNGFLFIHVPFKLKHPELSFVLSIINTQDTGDVFQWVDDARFLQQLPISMVFSCKDGHFLFSEAEEIYDKESIVSYINKHCILFPCVPFAYRNVRCGVKGNLIKRDSEYSISTLEIIYHEVARGVGSKRNLS